VSSQFSPAEILSIIVAWTVLSVAITYQKLVGLLTGAGSLDVVIAGFVATATGFILHEMGHKYVAIQRGYLAHFRLWIWGLVLTLSIVTISGGGLVFGAPGAVYISPSAAGFYGYDSSRGRVDPEEDNMIISAAGPGINLAFAIGFLALLFSVPSGFLSTVAFFGLLLNVGLGSFNMLPVPPLDGSKIFRKSLPIALALALPLWAMFIAFNFII
jgi:Zn-dependent protease